MNYPTGECNVFIDKKIGATIAVVLAVATSANAEITGSNGFSIFGNNSGAGFSIFGDNHGSGFGIYPSDVENGGFSIFGNNSGSGFSIFGDNHGSGFSIFGNNSGSGFSIFGNNNGSGFGVSGLVCLGIDALGNCIGWGVNRQVAPTPPAMNPRNTVVAIHCGFSTSNGDVLMLAETVVDCESSGGQVHPDIKAAHDAARDASSGN